jgi:hypothetical protein
MADPEVADAIRASWRAAAARRRKRLREGA